MKWLIIPLIGIILSVYIMSRPTYSEVSYEVEEVQVEEVPTVQERVEQQCKDLKPSDITKLINEERAEVDLNPLKLNTMLNKSAKAKLNHMIENSYWSHNSPDGIEAWHWFEQVGYDYDQAGENLANWYPTPHSMVDQWMKSDGHRKVMLDTLYSDIGTASKMAYGYNNHPYTCVTVAHFGTR